MQQESSLSRTPEYRATDLASVRAQEDAYARPAFSVGNRLRRSLWNACWLLLYRPTPRPLHAWRAVVLRLFGAEIGAESRFYPGARIWAPWNLVAEDHVAVAQGVEIYNPSPVHLASHVILSQDCYLCGATHDYNDPEFPLLAYRMHLGAYAWICARASVGPGVQVGEGAVLGLGGVATRDLEPWTVYGGNPAAALRTRQKSPAVAVLASGEPQDLP